jgi:fatty-acyl-CoA synthase
MPTPDISLGSWLAKRADRSPRRRALTFEGATWTYGELQDRIDRLAAGLRAHGLNHGDRIAFLGFNQPAFLEVLFAASRLGAIFVPLNFRLTGAELSYIINDAGAHTIVADEPHRAVLEGIRDELPCRQFVAADGHAPGWTALADVAGHSAPLTDHLVPTIDGEEVAVIMYTSGTTGRPKGAMLTHANLWWNNTNNLHMMDVQEDDVTLTMAPLFHIGGLNVTTLTTLQKGGEVVLHRTFDPAAFLADVPNYGVTTTFGVPAMLLFISQHPEFDSTDLTTLRMVICGGAPVPEPLIKLYNGRGIPINQGYGLTETAPSLTFLTAEHSMAKVGSAGRTPLFTEVRLVDPAGALVTEPLAKGEVCARGPNIMKGYWNKPEATGAAIDAEGWFHTGDVGYLDDEGFLFIADRVKDMVITGGENVYPAEVESVLYDHPAIAEVAVIGLPDERWGEAVVAIAALRPGETLTLPDLRGFAGDRLAAYKLPSRLELVGELPRNPAGKVLKFELRDRFGP